MLARTTTGPSAGCRKPPQAHYLHEGGASVRAAHGPRQVASLLAGHFRAALSRGLAVAARRWAAGGAAEERDRLAPVVEALSQRRAPALYEQQPRA